ncbi:MAG: 6-phosphogluconolactonase, partial [Actinobacteria bacterium]|nr:6-phosphogluconolactonase [Actinomycetota bacterium]
MAELFTEKRVVVSADPSSLADSVATRFLQRTIRRVSAGKITHISLTGGSMGTAVLAAISRHHRRDEVDWSRVHFWWSDERFVPVSSDDRNEKQARAALLDALSIPAENI